MRVVEPRFVVDTSIKFRIHETADWQLGRTRNLSRSGLLFAYDQSLEIGTVLELALVNHDWQGQEIEGRFCSGQVVRRVLMTWLEVGILVAIRFLEYAAQGTWRTEKAS